MNSGTAVIGNVGHASHRSFTAIGDTINVAARLETASEPGQVLIGPLTHELARGRFVMGPARELLLKGKGEPIRAYIVESVVT